MKLSTSNKNYLKYKGRSQNTTIGRDTHYSLTYNWPNSETKAVKLLKINMNQEAPNRKNGQNPRRDGTTKTRRESGNKHRNRFTVLRNQNHILKQ